MGQRIDPLLPIPPQQPQAVSQSPDGASDTSLRGLPHTALGPGGSLPGASTPGKVTPSVPQLAQVGASGHGDPSVGLFVPDSYMDRFVRRVNELFYKLSDSGGGPTITDGTTTSTSSTIVVNGGTVSTVGDTTTITITETITAEAHEAIAAGQFVAVYDDAGVAKCRVAKSSSGQGYQADGWVDAAYSASATVTIFLPGSVNSSGGTGLDAGDVWLGTDGYATSTPPTTAGYISQQIGVAESGSSVAFEPMPDILIETAGDTGTPGIELLDEGVSLGNITSINAVGSAITASISGDDGTLTVTGGQAQTLYVYFA